MKLSVGQVHRIAIVGELALAGILTVAGASFLFSYVYRSVTETEYIVTLQREYGIQPLNYHAYKQVLDDQESRARRPPPEWEKARDPFLPY